MRPLYLFIHSHPIASSSAFSYTIDIGCIATLSMLLGYYEKTLIKLRSPKQRIIETSQKLKDRLRPTVTGMNRTPVIIVYAGALIIIYGVIIKDFLIALTQGIPLIKVTLERGLITGTQTSI